MSVTPLNLSFEFFPPRTEKGEIKLQATLNELQSYRPEFYSVTFGAGGSTRDKTLETVSHIQQQGLVDASPHISCIGATRESIAELLDLYRAQGISRLVALRGDMPSGMRDPGDFLHASDLVRFIRETTGDAFSIAVAAYPETHPQARNLLTDLQNFKVKMDSGADFAITQYFYTLDAFWYFREACQAVGIDKPIIPGIMPILNFENLVRFSQNCGAEIPRWVHQVMQAYDGDVQTQQDYGVDLVTRLCEQLLAEGVDGLHFYTMNQSRLSLRILDNLGLTPVEMPDQAQA